MLKIEFKRTFHNKIFIYIFLINLICFSLGIILPIGLDHIKNITNTEFLFSVYTVYTQFGMLMFSFVIAQMFSKDYTEHYIYFYNQFKISLFRNILNKFIVFFSENIICIGCFILLSQIYFHSWKYSALFFILLLLVIIPYFIIVCLFSMISQNILMIIGLSLLTWLLSIIFITFGGIWKYINVFDASNINYQYLNDFMGHYIQKLPMQFHQNIFIELFVLLIILLIITSIKSKKWKYGL